MRVSTSQQGKEYDMWDTIKRYLILAAVGILLFGGLLLLLSSKA